MLSKLFRILLLMPIFYWLYLIFSGHLGADPAKSLNHKTGEVTLYYILLNLLIGLLISFQFRWNQKLKFLLTSRRFLGLTSFVFLLFHTLLYFVMESFEFKAVEQIYTKTYLICATLAFLILLALAMTSNDYSVKKMKLKNWKRLHSLVYLTSFFFLYTFY
jgi:sulfoxide reductase heme-binding subunit YedZ